MIYCVGVAEATVVVEIVVEVNAVALQCVAVDVIVVQDRLPTGWEPEAIMLVRQLTTSCVNADCVHEVVAEDCDEPVDEAVVLGAVDVFASFVDGLSSLAFSVG